jgi:hypothetical protein
MYTGGYGLHLHQFRFPSFGRVVCSIILRVSGSPKFVMVQYHIMVSETDM